jgi:hypothetical protein
MSACDMLGAWLIGSGASTSRQRIDRRISTASALQRMPSNPLGVSWYRLPR